MTVEINLDANRIRRGGEGRSEQDHAGKGGEVGSGSLIEEGGVETEDPWIWDNSNGYKVANLTKYGQSLVSLCPLYRVWNTTAILCARLWYTKTVQ